MGRMLPRVVPLSREASSRARRYPSARSTEGACSVGGADQAALCVRDREQAKCLAAR